MSVAVGMTMPEPKGANPMTGTVYYAAEYVHAYLHVSGIRRDNPPDKSWIGIMSNVSAERIGGFGVVRLRDIGG